MANLATYLAYVVIAFSANCSYGLTSFGPAILFQFGWHVCEILGVPDTGDITDAVTDIFVISLFVSPVQFSYLRALVNWPLTLTMLFFSIIFTWVGLEVLYAVHSDWLKVILGGVFLFVAVWKLGLQYKMRTRAAKGPPPSAVAGAPTEQWSLAPLSHKVMVVTASSFSGFLSGLFGTKGPPLMVFVTFSGIQPNEWRASSACMSTLIAPLQVAYTIFYKGDFEVNSLASYGVMVPCALVGLYCGNMLADRTNRQFVSNVILVLLVLGSLLLMTATSDTATAYMLGAVIGIALVLFAATIIMFAVRQYQAWRAQKERAQNVEYESLLY